MLAFALICYINIVLLVKNMDAKERVALIQRKLLLILI